MTDSSFKHDPMKNYKIGYCPTMQAYADTISEKVPSVEMLDFGSAGQVLSLLKHGNLDGVLIGRTAENRETDENTACVRLKNGITLAFKMKYGIPEEQLKEIDVITYLKPEQVEHVKHFFKEIHYFNTLDECTNQKLEVPVLVDWNDFRDDFQLLIPMNDFGKTAEFRAPVIYHKNICTEAIETIKNIIQ